MHDVAVVGAGPAGATLARLLGAAGADVLLLERCALPRPKPCGGGLTRRSLDLLPAEARALVRVWCPGVAVSHRGRMLRLRSPTPAVGLVRRSEFDACLVDLAAAQGAQVLQRAPVTAARALPDGVELTAGGRLVRARLLACADGTTGPFSGPMGAAVGLPGRPPRIGAVEAEIEDPGGRWGDEPRGDFDLLPGGYGWVFPQDGVLSVGVASWAGPSGGRLRQTLQEYLRRLGLEQRRVLALAGHPIPVGGRLPPSALAGPAAIRLGDAAGLCDPLFGEGIAHALAGAHLALHPLLQGRPEAYAYAVEEALYPKFRLAAGLSRLFYAAPQPWLALARAWPRLADRLYTAAVRGTGAPEPPAGG